MRAANRPNPRPERGFSLLELAIVLVVIVVAASVLLTPSGSRDAQRLESAAQEIVAALRYARTEAMRRGVHVGVNADLTTQRLRLFVYDTAQSTPAEDYSVMNPVNKRLYTVQMDDGGMRGGVRIASADFYAGSQLVQGSITFDPRGRPMLLKNHVAYPGYTWGAIQLAAGNAQRGVLVDPETGRTSLQ